VGFEPVGPIHPTQLIDFNTRQKRQNGQIARIEVHGRYTALRYTITQLPATRAVENNARTGPHRGPCPLLPPRVFTGRGGGDRQHHASHDVRQLEKAQYVPSERELLVQSPLRGQPSDHGC